MPGGRHRRPDQVRTRQWLLPALLVLAWLAVGGVLGPLAGGLSGVSLSGVSLSGWSLSGVSASGALAALPPDTEAIEALERNAPFSRPEALPGTLGDDRPGESTDPAAPLRSAATLGAFDLLLVLVTSATILLIMMVVYRSPLLPLVVLVAVGTALGVSQGVLYLLVSRDWLIIDAEGQAVLAVLVLGTATDYAMLLVTRYRAELREHANRFVAAHAAWRASLQPIATSAAIVGLGLLCLLVSDLGTNRHLGPAAAIGMLCALLAMTTFLPALLALLGRAAFWPQRVDAGSARAEQAGVWPRWPGVWPRVAALVDRRPRLVWVSTAIGLTMLSLGVLRLDASGIPPPGADDPVIVMVRPEFADVVAGVAREVAGVATVTPFVGVPPPGSQAPEPAVRDGMSRLDVTLDSAPDSAEAVDTVRALRTAVHGVSGADAVVGGSTAVQLDFVTTAAQDRIVMPLVLSVMFLLVALLLRALVAPLLLLLTVALSFLAALGTSASVFEYLLGFPNIASTLPLHAFVVLVALGVDYNVFLISRVRAESARHGTRQATLIALVATGGVITSAGIVLAATFSALALVSLVPLVPLACTVALGVLLDTLIVRSLLVPALVIDTDHRFWWPGRLARSAKRVGLSSVG